MNKELLFNLYGIHSPSGSEKKMRKFLKRQARQRGATKIEQDIHGNLFITKGESETYPCLASHMDQVQRNHSKDFRCLTDGEIVCGFSMKAREQQGLGADDKNGIYICLECLEKYDAIKIAFFVGEETGCQGSSRCDLSFFSDCRFIIEPDRRGSNDLITSMCCGEVCSDEFIDAINAKAFGYKEAVGSVTDVGELVERGVGISCLNLSCGYYEAHSDEEFTILSELENCLNFVQSIIENCTKVYPYEYTYSYGYGGYSTYGYSYGRYGGDYSAADRAYEEFDVLLSCSPDTSYEEAVFYLSDDIRSHVPDVTLREIYDDVLYWYREKDVQSWNESFKAS